MKRRPAATLLAALTLSLTATALTSTAQEADARPAPVSQRAGASSTDAAHGARVSAERRAHPSKKHKKPKKAKHRKHRKHHKGKHRPLPKKPVRAAATPFPFIPNADNPTNPLANHAWGVYQGPGDQTWAPYVNATGATKAALARIALAPKSKWFGDWISTGDIADRVRDYIVNSQAGNPDALVQMADFRMVPWEHDVCSRLPTAAEQASYKAWTDQFAAALGNARTAIILQPDGPFALCTPGGSTLPSSLIAYAARAFSAHPNTSVYIDAGAADWPAPGSQGGVGSAVRILTQSGIQYARGFALNSTHYSDTNLEVVRGAQIAQQLAAQGIGGKHFVVNTSSNGHPFVFGDYTGPDDNDAFVCQSKHEPASETCVTLGIPPTYDVTNPRWGMAATTNALARTYVDGYLWFGRPWLYRQADPFVLQRALDLVASTPY